MFWIVSYYNLVNEYVKVDHIGQTQRRNLDICGLENADSITICSRRLHSLKVWLHAEDISLS